MDFILMGQNIKKQRKKYQLTQIEMSEKLNCSVGYLSKVERGVTKPSMAFLEKIINLTGCDIKDLWC